MVLLGGINIIQTLSVLSRYKPDDIALRFGDYDKDDSTFEPLPLVERRISEIFPHESFDQYTYEYDIALLLLKV